MAAVVRTDWYITQTWATLVRMGSKSTRDEAAMNFHRVSIAFTCFGAFIILFGCIAVAVNVLG